MEEKVITISFSGLLSILKKEKWIVLAILVLVTGVSLFFVLRLKDEYTSIGKILPEVKGGDKLGNVSGFAALAGINLNQEGTEAIRPDLYPDVINSVPFYLELLKTPVTTESGKKITVRQYAFETFFEADSTTAYQKKKPIKPIDQYSIGLSHFTYDLIKELRKRITAAMDKKSGVISVSAKMQDRYVATQVATIGLNYLTAYISNYRTQKEKQNVAFFEDQMKRAKNRFYSTQAQKAQYADSYQAQYMRMQGMDVQRERIETEYQFSQAFYKQLEQKYEQAKIELQNETPVLKVLEPPIIPNEKSEPKRSVTVLISLFLGLFLGLLIAIIKSKNYKEVFIYS
jgi:uncharacterized protein involved in exopolysaccharide biosynthesis